MRHMIFVVLAAFAMAVVGCGDAKHPDPSPRATARVALVSMASLLEFGFNACAEYVEESGDAKAGEDCLAVLRPAKDGIYAAADAMKAWQDGEDKDTLGMLGCAAKATLVALEGVKKVLAGVGVPTPAWAEDALSWARWASAMALPKCGG